MFKVHGNLDFKPDEPSDQPVASLTFDMEEIKKCLLFFVISTGSSFRIVDNKYFKQLIKLVSAGKCIKMPGRLILASDILDLYANQFKSAIQVDLGNIESCAITSDCWSSISNDGYLSLTIHYIDKEFQLRSVSLGKIETTRLRL